MVPAAGEITGVAAIVQKLFEIDTLLHVIEEVIEPYLIQEGLLQRTPRGRMLTAGGYRYLGLAEPARGPQLDLLAETAAEEESDV